MVVLECLRAIALLVEYVADGLEELAVFGMSAQRLHVPVLGLTVVALLLVGLGNLAVDLRVARLHGVQLEELIERLLEQADLAVGEAQIVQRLDARRVDAQRLLVLELGLLVVALGKVAVALVRYR